MSKYDLSIAQAVNSNNQNAGGALLDNKQQSMVVRGVGLIQSVSHIENIVAMLGMVPAARATGIGSDVQRPLPGRAQKG